MPEIWPVLGREDEEPPVEELILAAPPERSRVVPKPPVDDMLTADPAPVPVDGRPVVEPVDGAPVPLLAAPPAFRVAAGTAEVVAVPAVGA
jgi:hypothetical protein